MRGRRIFLRMRQCLRMLLFLLCAQPFAAAAQLLEPLQLPPLREVLQPPLREVIGGVTAPASTLTQPLATVARQLLRRHPAYLESDPRGLPIMRAVIIALSPDPDALARALARGYVIQDDRQLEGLDQRLVTLLVPRGTSTRAALRDLRAADPQGQYDFDHLYVESGAAPLPSAPATAAAADAPVNIRVGLIDGGVDAAHPVFQRKPPTISGCNGIAQPSAHGTAVASLFVGWSAEFTGAAPGAELLAVDVYCGGEAPGGRMRDVVTGLSSLAAASARVVNMSIVGPDNAVLAAAVRAVQARSILIVAATGNDGPNAKPLYPAAYPGVVAVSAVDARMRVLPEASGGRHVSFAAPGADLIAAAPAGAFQQVRGTSFAAPLVAGMLASALAMPDADSAEILRQLAATAEDRGARGRDRRYGHGLIGRELPARGLMAQPAR
jgi:subtilisin family serine protease